MINKEKIKKHTRLIVCEDSAVKKLHDSMKTQSLKDKMKQARETGDADSSRLDKKAKKTALGDDAPTDEGAKAKAKDKAKKLVKVKVMAKGKAKAKVKAGKAAVKAKPAA